jgi:hypothetical protein
VQLALPHGDLGADDIVEVYAKADDFDNAARWLTRAYDAKDFTLFTLALTRSIPPAFFHTAGWQTLSKRPLLRDWQAAHDRLAADLATAQ